MKKYIYIIFAVCCQMTQLSAATHAVASSNFAFSPNSLSISAGDVVEFTNAGGFHFVQWLTAPTTLPNNSTTLSSTPQPYMFTVAGTYTYQCGFHPSMKGSITVAILPIALRSFAVEPKGNSLLLTWLTASESNTATFSIERAQSDKQFQEIGTVKAGGQSNQPLAYTFQDASAPFSNVYYRLKTMDIDETFSYSPIISIQMLKAFTVKTYPNPATHIVSFEWYVPDLHHAELTIFDASGKNIAGPFAVEQHHGLSRFDCAVSAFAAGKYVAILSSVHGYMQPLPFVVTR